MTQEQYNAIAEAISYELAANLGSGEGIVIVNRIALSIARKLKMIDQSFATDSFLIACGIQE